MDAEPVDRETLVVTNMALVIFIAQDVKDAARSHRVEWDDLISEGNLGLVKAAQRWDPAKSEHFGPFAGEYIRRALRKAARGKRFPETGRNLDRFQSVRRPPSLVPLFPITALDPQSACPHRRRIERGSIFCCMVCHCSGQDHHPAMEIGPSDIRKPEKPKSRPLLAAELAEPLKETRRQRRAKQFGHLKAISA